MKRKGVIAVMAIVLLFGLISPFSVNASGLPIYSIQGTVFDDVNANGIMELHQLDLAMPKMKVDLFKTLADAQQSVNIYKTTTTNALGIYGFVGLSSGTYFIKYSTEQEMKPIVQRNTALDASGTPIAGIVQVTVQNGNLVSWIDLATKKVTHLTMTVFEDLNANANFDSNESILNGKTMIFIDLRKLNTAINDGSLEQLDVAKIVTQTLTGGNVDIADAIFFRTTSGGKKIEMPEVDPGFYVMMRSPFNLTLQGVLTDSQKITSFMNLIQSGDPTEFLNNSATLLDTGDIDTTPTNEYIKKIAAFLPKAVAKIDSVEVTKYLGEDAGNATTAFKDGVDGVGNLLNNIPATRFGIVDIWGNAYDLTGFKFNKTNDYLFGIKQLITISGTIYGDANGNGVRDGLELGKAATVTAYDKDGRVLGTSTTINLIGAYSINKLPYDKEIYLTIDGTTPFAPEYSGTVPEALQGKRIFGVYNLPFSSATTGISQNVGLASISDIGVTLKSTDVNKKSAVVTLVNKNYSNLTVEYKVNNGQIFTTTINTKILVDTKKDITLTNLALGTNILEVRWITSNYKGEWVQLPIVIP